MSLALESVEYYSSASTHKTTPVELRNKVYDAVSHNGSARGRPPSYTQDFSDGSHVLQKTYFDEKIASTPSALPTHLNDAQVHTLHVAYKNWKSTTALVTSSDPSNILYTVDFPTITKSRMRFTAAGSENPYAEAKFHCLSSKIDLTIHHQTTELKRKRLWGSTYEWSSPAFGGCTMSWMSKSRFNALDFVCVNEQQLPVARYRKEGSCWSPKSWKNLGSVEFLGPIERAAQDEILVTALAMVYVVMQSTNAAAASSASSASSAAAASVAT